MNYRKEFFEQISNFDVKGLNEEEIDSQLEVLNNIFDLKNTLDIECISEDEAWILIDFTNRIPSDILDGYFGEYNWLVEEIAEGWPYNDRLLLLPVYQDLVLEFKIFSLEAGGQILESKSLPTDKHIISLNIEEYWKDITWENINLSELRFLFLVLCTHFSENDIKDETQFHVDETIQNKLFNLIEKVDLFVGEKQGFNFLLPVDKKLPLY